MTIMEDVANNRIWVATDVAPAHRRPLRDWLRGSCDVPRWERPGVLVLLVAGALLYLWRLGSLGWGNEYYAAAVQAGAQNATALLFGSLDSGNAITVDKPPAAMWVMGLSGRLFGFNSWRMLVPQALMGVAAVWLLYAAVRRTNGPAAGLLAGYALALTPVAALMFRFNNPDALLVVLLTAAAYCVVRALQSPRSIRWIALAGSAIGFAFLAKLMQAFLVVPALGIVVLVAMPGGVRKRLAALFAGLTAMLISGGWYIALVSLWPADSRPYIGGSTDNSLLQLALGYNGLGSVLGGDGNPTGGGGSGEGAPGGAMFGGSPGLGRMFGDSMGTEISWLLPAALIGLVAGLWLTRRTPRTSPTRGGLLLWGGWVVVTMLVFSYMRGIMHPYYTIALAPGVAAVLALSVTELWKGRRYLSSRIWLGLMLAATGVWSYVLLARTPDWVPWLRWTVLFCAILATAVLVVGGHQLRRYSAVLAFAGLLAGFGGAAAYTVHTVVHPHGGGMPSSGPTTGGHRSGLPPGPGGGKQSAREREQLQALLKSADNRWAAAAVGSHGVSALELSAGAPIMAIGGFMGSDPAPTLAQFQRYVDEGQIRYFLVDDGAGRRVGRDPGSSGAQIAQWVADHFLARTVDGTTVYDLQAA
jgi:4-amino-4-deoxy-L-arabinose transferase-like glycosyltransferase